MWQKKVSSQYRSHIRVAICHKSRKQRVRDEILINIPYVARIGRWGISQVIFHRQYHMDKISLQKRTCYQNIYHVYIYIAINLSGKQNLRHNHVEELCTLIELKGIIEYFLRAISCTCMECRPLRYFERSLFLIPSLCLCLFSLKEQSC